MTQEEKGLLMKDLGARLAYQPLCKKVDTEDNFCECDAPLGYSLRDLVDNKIIIKPYLRPMSSMTGEEKKELLGLLKNLGMTADVKRLDWLVAHHFDIRSLIEKGLALEAPSGMYKKEEQL